MIEVKKYFESVFRNCFVSSGGTQLNQAFLAYANFGAATGKNNTELESRQLKKMLETAGLLNKGRLDGAEMDMIYTRCKGPSKKIPYNNFRDKAIPQIAQARFGNSTEDSKQKVIQAVVSNAPGFNSNLNMSKDDVVNRLTDHKGYTGAHKSRFDSTGKGRGIEGRMDRDPNTGYVQGYQNQGSYGKK